MQIEIVTDYAFRILFCLLSFPPALSIHEIVVQLGIGEDQIMQIIPKLVQAGWIKQFDHSDGRYTLAVDGRSISLFDVILLMEHKVMVNPCMQDGDYCSLFATRNCPIRSKYGLLQTCIEGLLRQFKLSDIIHDDMSKIANDPVSRINADSGRMGEDGRRLSPQEIPKTWVEAMRAERLARQVQRRGE